MDNKLRPIPLLEAGVDIPKTTFINGSNDTLYFQITDRNGTPYDITTGTITSVITDAYTGAVVSVTGSTTAKVTNALGIVSFSGFTWATGYYNYYITFVSGGITRIFGPYKVEVEAL